MARGSILIGDGDAETRKLAARLLRTVGFDVVEATSGESALETARESRPAAIVLDADLDDISGYHVCHALRKEIGPSLPILLLSSRRTEPNDRAVGLLVGANEYFAKPIDPSELLAWVERHAGQTRVAGSLGDDLTPSERRVLELLASGVAPNEISETLTIAPKTVSMHIQNTMRKLDVHSRTQAVALAHKLGIVAAP